MDCTYTLYVHISPTNKYYVGITSKPVEVRWGKDGLGYKSNEHFWRAIQKYGWNNFKHEILLAGLTEEQAYAYEIEYIKFYNSNDSSFGYNKSLGGEKSNLGTTYSPEVRKKLSDIHKQIGCTSEQLVGLKNHWKQAKGVPLSDSTKLKISEANSGKKRTPEQIARNVEARKGKYTGKNNKLYGTHRSDETKQKLREAALKQFENGVSEETRKKMSENNAHYWKGKSRSDETKKKLREASLKQFENGIPEETRKKMSIAHKGKKDSDEVREKKRIAALKREAKKRGETYEC